MCTYSNSLCHKLILLIRSWPVLGFTTFFGSCLFVSKNLCVILFAYLCYHCKISIRSITSGGTSDLDGSKNRSGIEIAQKSKSSDGSETETRS